jgi:hypothetical protein
MKTLRPIALCLLLLAAVGAFAGEVIDGVVATVNRKPVLESDWDDAVRFEAFMQQKPLAAVTEADRVGALQRLIDRRLLEMQMNERSPLAPSSQDIRLSLATLREQISGAQTPQGWTSLLAAYGFTEPAIEANLRDQKQVMNFIEVRLRPNVHVQPEEIEAYYRSQVVPDMKKAGLGIIALQELQGKIHELLVQQHIDQLLDAWLHNLRQQSQIRSTITLPRVPSSPERPGLGGN